MTQTTDISNTKTMYPVRVDDGFLPEVCRQSRVLEALSISQPTLWRLGQEHEIYRPERPHRKGVPPLFSRRRVRLMA